MIDRNNHNQIMTTETGVQLLARLGSSRPSINRLEPGLFGVGPAYSTAHELYGEDGTGKSEMLLHLISSCILPDRLNHCSIGGLNASVIFIDTEYKFSILHLALLLEKKLKKILTKDPELLSCVEDMEALIKTCLKRLHLIRCTSSSNLLLTLHSLEKILATDMISLVMIDSISSFYWMDRCNGGDSTTINLIAEILDKLLTTYRIVLIVTRTAIFKHTTVLCDNDMDRVTVDYLGSSWHNLITHKYILTASMGCKQIQVQCKLQKLNTRFLISDSGIEFLS